VLFKNTDLLGTGSYSGGRDQEDCGLKPAGQTVHETLSQKNPSQKRVRGVAQGIDPEVKPQYHI
jgi:hypothetical protein